MKTFRLYDDNGTMTIAEVDGVNHEGPKEAVIALLWAIEEWTEGEIENDNRDLNTVYDLEHLEGMKKEIKKTIAEVEKGLNIPTKFERIDISGFYISEMEPEEA